MQKLSLDIQGTTPSHSSCAVQPGDANALLRALWRTGERVHFLSTQDKLSGRFQNLAVPASSEAATFAQTSSAIGLNVYFACAEFTKPDGRTLQNAAGAWGFWCDVDCGPGKPYADTEKAHTAVTDFCAKAGFPAPTHVVNSGLGLHVYWSVDGFLNRELWLTYAAKLKALMKVHGLHADPSRTADIASVLRIPGTLNNKYNPPKPVTLLSATEEYLSQQAFLDAIDAAFINSGVKAEAPASISKTVHVVPKPLEDATGIQPPDLLQLESALKALDPDCDEKTWKFYRLAPLAYLSRAYPELHDTLRELAIRWSSGDLRGEPSWKWNNPGSNGLSGEQIFDSEWARFLTDNYSGKRVSVGTIFYHAKEVGWASNPVVASDDGGKGMK